MKITTIAVSYGRTLNLGGYQSARLDITMTAELEAGDDLDTIQADLWRQAKASVKAQAMPLLKPQLAEAHDIFNGLPVEVQEEIQRGH